jgi:hypothetical protein
MTLEEQRKQQREEEEKELQARKDRFDDLRQRVRVLLGPVFEKEKAAQQSHEAKSKQSKRI